MLLFPCWSQALQLSLATTTYWSSVLTMTKTALNKTMSSPIVLSWVKRRPETSRLACASTLVTTKTRVTSLTATSGDGPKSTSMEMMAARQSPSTLLRHTNGMFALVHSIWESTPSQRLLRHYSTMQRPWLLPLSWPWLSLKCSDSYSNGNFCIMYN